MIKLLIFDVGGTLLDFHSGMEKVNIKILKKLFNVEATEDEIQKIINNVDLKYVNSYKLKTTFSDLVSKAILKKYGISTSKYKEFLEERNKIIDYRENKPYSDVVPIIKKLKKKYYIATLANVHEKRFHKRVLAKTKVGKHFHLNLDSDSVGIRKPSIKIFKMVLNHFKIKPTETVMIGDNPTADIFGAKRLGIHTILLNRRRLNYHFINKTKPDFEVTSLHQLLPILNKL
jgi:putative hydrolase of the HAD superfamily